MSSRSSRSDYYRLPAESIAVRVATHQRRKMFDRFLLETALQEQDSILDVGVTCDQSYSSSNYLEAWWPHKDRIIAVGTENADFLEQIYPDLRFVAANGLRLPFADQAFDVVHSSAVIEHVGSIENQRTLLRECVRVARRAVFLTTPNRWFPIEFHTALPFVHWLPKAVSRRVMRLLGIDFYSREEHLNLLSVRDLDLISRDIFEMGFHISCVRLVGISSNLLLVGKRRVSR